LHDGKAILEEEVMSCVLTDKKRGDYHETSGLEVVVRVLVLIGRAVLRWYDSYQGTMSQKDLK